MRNLRDTTGLSLAYRFAWRMEYFFVTFTGPAQQSGSLDPKARLRRERAERVAAAYGSSGCPVPAAVQEVIDAQGVDLRSTEYTPELWERLGKFRGQ